MRVRDIALWIILLAATVIIFTGLITHEIVNFLVAGKGA